MRSTHYVLLACAAIGAMCAAPANAAETVLSTGDAFACYQAAEDGGDMVSALQSCNQALKGVLSTDDRAATFVNRGILYMTSAQWNAALADFDAGLALNPQMGEGHVDRGASLVALKKYSEAIREIDSGIQLGSKKQQLAYYDRAMAQEALGHVDKAYADYKQALSIDPDFTLATTQLARFKVVMKGGT